MSETLPNALHATFTQPAIKHPSLNNTLQTKALSAIDVLSSLMGWPDKLHINYVPPRTSAHTEGE